MEYDNRGIARVLFHGFGAIPRVLVSSDVFFEMLTEFKLTGYASKSGLSGDSVSSTL